MEKWLVGKCEGYSFTTKLSRQWNQAKCIIYDDTHVMIVSDITKHTGFRIQRVLKVVLSF